MNTLDRDSKKVIGQNIAFVNLLQRFRRILLSAIALSTIFVTFVLVYNTFFNSIFFWKFTIYVFYCLVSLLNLFAVQYIVRVQPLGSTSEEMKDISILSGVFSDLHPEEAEEKKDKLSTLHINRLPLTSYQFDSNDSRMTILNGFLSRFPKAVYFQNPSIQEKTRITAEINARKISMDGKHDQPIILLGDKYDPSIKMFEKLGIYTFLLSKEPSDLDSIDDSFVLNGGKFGKQQAQIFDD